MFGIGWAEILVLGLCGVVVGGGTLAAVIALVMSRKSRSEDESSQVAAMRAEIQRLREENERLRKG